MLTRLPPKLAMSRKNDSSNTGMGRRAWIKGAALLGGAASVAPGAGNATRRTPDEPALKTKVRGLILACNSNAVVETESGKVRGYTRNGIYAFKGIPYAASTAGNARFLPPGKAEPWTGVRSSMMYGPVCPQVPRSGWSNDEEAWLYCWDDGVPGEDCLRINLWSPGLGDGKKRPVMVLLHGGGFSAGSSQELKAYDGERLSRRGDVVVVSLNHRLGVLGFLDLAAYGDSRYAGSANVGMLDLVAALEWVRDHIGNFGGDPGNVTIFGQSGGGGKVGALMAMPQAKGLFHRAVIQSGSLLRATAREDSEKLAAATLQELGLSGDSKIDQIQTLPVASLVAAANRALASLTPPMNPAHVWDRIGWEPTVDGTILPTHPFDPVAPQLSAHVPLLVGTVSNEFVSGINNPKLETLSDRNLINFAAKFGDADRIVAAYRRANPTARPSDLLSLISAAPVRRNALLQAERKTALGAAPVYVYLFAWKTPVLDGRPRCFHGLDLAFVFDNVSRCENMTGGVPEAHELAAKMSEAWISFARSGDPNHHGLPKWPAFTNAQGATMVFDNHCRAENNPDREELLAITE
jgi:para-nitrobenzyl esterase